VELKHLIAFEKWTCLLAVLALASGILFLDRHAALSLSLGAGMMAANSWSIRTIAEKYGLALRARPGFAMLLFNLKMGAIVALCWVLINYVHVDPKWFAIGISVLPAAIVIVGIEHGLRREDSTNG
jgi:energy-converting hydrogenase Eha subunit B